MALGRRSSSMSVEPPASLAQGDSSRDQEELLVRVPDDYVPAGGPLGPDSKGGRACVGANAHRGSLDLELRQGAFNVHVRSRYGLNYASLCCWAYPKVRRPKLPSCMLRSLALPCPVTTSELVLCGLHAGPGRSHT
jgi:hypothetical protein